MNDVHLFFKEAKKNRVNKASKNWWKGVSWPKVDDAEMNSMNEEVHSAWSVIHELQEEDEKTEVDTKTLTGS